MNRFASSIAGAIGALALLGASPLTRAEVGGPDAVGAASPAADAGFTLPERRLAHGSPGTPDAPTDGGRLVAFTSQARAAMRDRLQFIADHRAHHGWLQAASDPIDRARENPVQIAFFVDRQLDIAAAGAALMLTPGFSIGATLEVPFTDFGYDFESNRVGIGATITF